MAENTAVFHVLTVYRTVALHTTVYRLYRYTAQHQPYHAPAKQLVLKHIVMGGCFFLRYTCMLHKLLKHKMQRKQRVDDADEPISSSVYTQFDCEESTKSISSTGPDM
jgi:hypothetical protein